MCKKWTRKSVTWEVRLKPEIRGSKRYFFSFVSVFLFAACLQIITPTVALSDGQSWTSITAAEANWWKSVAYGDGAWVAIANGSSNANPTTVMRSTDNGMTWSNNFDFAGDSTSLISANFMSVAYGDGVFVAVADASNGQKVMRSTDGGYSWNGIQTSVDQWSSVAYGNGTWHAVAYSGGSGRLMRSVDGGGSWSTVNTFGAFDNAQWWSVSYGDGVWIAVAKGR
ncbi:MAG: hypothetical protein CL431_00765, partial [Acidimicrobiaceae bacterium]|nr:hypothetical protein [Acidimicrobiaceae bacterium]